MMNPMMMHDGMMWGMGIGHQDFSDIIDYGLAEARKTNFDVQLLAGLRQYVESFLQYREGIAAARTAAATREAHRREEAERDVYERFRRLEARQLFVTGHGEPTHKMEPLTRETGTFDPRLAS